jgi:5-methylcytosine-specific restriction endonuclease McrA
MTQGPRNTVQRDRDRARIRATKANCGICGEFIDYTITAREHPRVFVVDHITPLAKGGLDVLANKQAAHRRPRVQL